MRSLIFFLINFFVLYNGTFGRPSYDDDVETRIINGQEARPNQFAFVGYLTKEYKVGFKVPYCGASIIHPRWILTAGHCCEDFGGKDDEVERVTFTAGTLDIQPRYQLYDMQVRNIKKFVHHPFIYDEYKNISDTKRIYKNVYDVAVARLDEDLILTDAVQIVELLRNTRGDFLGDDGYYMGWGRTDFLPNSTYMAPYLKFGRDTIMDRDECKKFFEDIFVIDTKYHFCTYSPYVHVSTCDGDSGGPLILRTGLQIGITTDVFCGEDYPERSPSVFTNVSVFFAWIREQLAMCGDEIFDAYVYDSSRPWDHERTLPDPNPYRCNEPNDCKGTKSVKQPSVPEYV